AVDLVLDRVLGGNQLVGDDVQLGEGRVEGGRLAGAGRAGHEGDPVRLDHDLAEVGQDVGRHADLVEVEADAALVEDPDDDRLAQHGRQDAHADVHRAAADVQLDPPVLG